MELPGVNEDNLDLNYEVKNNGENLKFKFTGKKNIKDIPETCDKSKTNKGNIVIRDFSLVIYLNPNDYTLQSTKFIIRVLMIIFC